jgi:histidine ammonia-lyase
VLAKGHSGISRDTLNQMLDAFNAGCVSAVPERGTVGASGDPAPRHDGKTSSLRTTALGRTQLNNKTHDVDRDIRATALGRTQHNLVTTMPGLFPRGRTLETRSPLPRPVLPF